MGGQRRRSYYASRRPTLNRRSAKRNEQYIIRPKTTARQLTVAAAIHAKTAAPWPRKRSKIEVPHSFASSMTGLTRCTEVRKLYQSDEGWSHEAAPIRSRTARGFSSIKHKHCDTVDFFKKKCRDLSFKIRGLHGDRKSVARDMYSCY